MPEITSPEEAREVARLIREGKLEGQSRTTAMEALRAFDGQQQQQQQARPAPAQAAPAKSEPAYKEWKDYGLADYAEATWDLAAATVTNFPAQILGGLAGALSGAGTAMLGGDRNKVANNAAAVKNSIEQLITNDPESEILGKGISEADQLLTNVTGKNAQWYGEKMDDFFYWLGAGDAATAAAWKTAVFGMPSIVGFGRMKIPQRMAVAHTASKTAKEVAKTDKAAGLPQQPKEIPVWLEKKTQGLVEPEAPKAVGWDDVLDDMRAKRAEKLGEIDTTWDSYRGGEAFFQVKPVKRAAQEARKKLIEEGFDLESMPQVRARLGEMSRLNRKEVGTGKSFRGDKKRTEASLRELHILRRRISKGITGDKRANIPFTQQDKALLSLKSKLDDALEEQFIRGAVSGDPAVFDTWKKATALSRDFEQSFNSDRIIRKMMGDDVSAQQAYNFAIGASAMGAKNTALTTVKRMKDILGTNSPAIVNMRKAALRDILLPLTDDNPHYLKAINNIDKMIKEHPDLLKELEIDVDELRQIRRYAYTSTAVKAAHEELWGSGTFYTGLMASVVFGHSIARKGALVRTMRKVLNSALGVGAISRKEVRKLLAEGDINTPIVRYSKPSGVNWAAQTGAAELSDSEEQ